MLVAVFYETWNGHAGLVAERIAGELRKAGHEVLVERCRKATSNRISQAGAIVVGSGVRMGKHHSKAVSFVNSNLEILKSKPSAFFSVSLTARLKNEQEKEEMKKLIAGFEERTGWKPARMAFFAGALMYTKYWFLLRWLMRKISRSQGNDTDTSKDHVYTDWNAVDEFAQAFAAELAGS